MMESMMHCNTQQSKAHGKAHEFPCFVEKEFKSLGTEISFMVVVRDEQEYDKAIADLELLPEVYARYMKIFSRFDLESELSRLNRSLGIKQQCSEEMRTIARGALNYWGLTKGVYDPRVIYALENAGYVHDFPSGVFESKNEGGVEIFTKPLTHDLLVESDGITFKVKMDFSGIVKGYVTDRVREFLVEKGWKDFLVDSGGDMYMAGNELSGSAWRIGIEGLPDQSIMFSLSEKGIATSGISRRKWEVAGKQYHHLINPKQADAFDFSLKSVTLIADTTEEADVWAKVLFLKGMDEGMRYAKKQGVAALFLPYQGGARISPECKRYVWKSA